jgi:hypothetical protein
MYAKYIPCEQVHDRLPLFSEPKDEVHRQEHGRLHLWAHQNLTGKVKHMKIYGEKIREYTQGGYESVKFAKDFFEYFLIRISTTKVSKIFIFQLLYFFISMRENQWHAPHVRP